MTIREALTVVGSVTLFGTALGGGVGYALGKHYPNYYRIVFRVDPKAEFDPVAVGLGLGISQGMIGGAAVGLAVVAIVAWYRTRLARPYSEM
jgi:hypothetical protein